MADKVDRSVNARNARARFPVVAAEVGAFDEGRRCRRLVREL